MEKHRHAKAAYKAYTLRDYQGLKQQGKMGGLGPSTDITQETVEKVRRQKLYSEVIRQQNKQISRIPFLPAHKHNAADTADKDAPTPRRKALEYARSISKPKVSPRVKRDGQENNTPAAGTAVGTGAASVAGTGTSAVAAATSVAVPERVRLMAGVDSAQLSQLESLRRRHEQEKQAVAQLNAIPHLILIILCPRQDEESRMVL
ncbi:jhy protein homolog isoform X2 [Engraulis encrasicolus]